MRASVTELVTADDQLATGGRGKGCALEEGIQRAHLAEHSNGGKSHAQNDPGSGLDEASVLRTMPALEVQI